MSWWSEGPASRVDFDPHRASAWEWEDLGTVRGGGDPPRAGSAAGPSDEMLDAERDMAFQEGFQKGVREGQAQGEARFRTALEALETALSQLDARAGSREGAAEERVRVLALAVARLLLDREVRSDPAEITQLVRRALALFPSEVPLKVRMNPEDLATLAQPVDGEMAPPVMARGGSLRWEADPEMGRGDVFVEAPERILDGRVVPCLERIWEELSDA